MKNIFIISILVAILFSIIKFVEVKYIRKDEVFKGIKEYIQDALIVLISSIISTYIYYTNEHNLNEMLNVVTDTKDTNTLIGTEKVEVFTDNPNF